MDKSDNAYLTHAKELLNNPRSIQVRRDAVNDADYEILAKQLKAYDDFLKLNLQGTNGIYLDGAKMEE